MYGISADTTTREDNPILDTMQPREVVGSDIFFVKNKIFLCNVDYYTMFSTVKKKQSGS